MSAPPLKVNKARCISGMRLFVNSNILAENENPVVFEESSVIDVYGLNNHHYELSFYVPKHKGKKMRDFRISDGTLIALHGNTLVSYDIGAVLGELEVRNFTAR